MFELIVASSRLAKQLTDGGIWHGKVGAMKFPGGRSVESHNGA